MSKIHRKSYSPIWLVLIIFLAMVDFALVIAYLLRDKNIALLNPKGQIAYEQFSLMVFTATVLFAIAIPTIFLLFFIAWKYRESNVKASPHSHTHRQKLIVAGMWVVPTIFICVLASAMFPATQKLAPQKSIAADAQPITIQVIAMRWKWLFIYPEQDIATVNFVQLPVNSPVKFELTADEVPMSSFWIPNIGGQLYAMTGHINPLYLMADVPGDYPGSTPEINGAGFAGMRFTTRVTSAENFEKWVEEVQQSPNVLDETAYKNLLRPSENVPTAFYSDYESNLYDKVVMKYMGGHDHQPEEYKGGH